MNAKRNTGLLARIHIAVRAAQDEPNPGERSAREWAKEWGLKQCQALRLCIEAHAAGLMTCRQLRRRTVSGSIVRTRYFAEKKHRH